MDNMGYVGYIILSLFLAVIGFYIDGAIFGGEAFICTFLFFFIPLIVFVYKIYDLLLSQKEKEDKINSDEDIPF